ncbi:hypothetical protein C8F04DRAFT_1220590 [Mycena alexandri]|uniref:CBS domain-containing protein n=1 Tax=Mycena alexandri TaxID=1745969 RepID=A0AAD6X737_9AGAR|nr:hypothetical protein C8F04DRAFT_1220590 [Mycena alexandri]
MAANKRMSQSFTIDPPQVVAVNEPDEAEQWVEDWRKILAKDLIDSRIVEVDAETSVEEACEILLSENIHCLAVKAPEAGEEPYLGLFDYADVNAFLTLAATRHTLGRDDLLDNSRVEAIVSAARSGHVPIRLVSNLSEKNPLETLPHSGSVVSLLELFSRGAHRVLIRSSDPSAGPFLGYVSDRRLLEWFAEYTPTSSYLVTPLYSLSLPSLHLFSAVVTATSTSSVLDAMRLMSEEGVSSVAVLDDDTGVLLSAVSVTDIGRIVVPSQSKQILSTPLSQFVALIKAPDGSTDGADRYPVYAVSPTSLLSFTIQKLLATSSHRLFITRDTSGSTSPIISSARIPGNLTGVVSVVDILSLFARLAHLDVDPARMQRHRRASSASTNSAHSARESTSRSNSRSDAARVTRTPSLRTNKVTK